MRNVLHLHPHKHTGKLLHHKHTSYHALLLLLAIAGGFIALTNHLATAASYDVSAIVPAPLPTTAAVITTPVDGTTVQTSDITVAGTCPIIDPAIIVVLYDNGDVVGSVRCSNSGFFSLPVSLAVGSHEFVATIINFTGQTGLSSQPVTIMYILPPTPPATVQPVTTPPVTSNNSSNDGSTNAPSNVGPLQLIPDAPFLVFGARTDTVWDGTIKGGTAPYTVRINWGDGTSQTYTGVAGGEQHLRHKYAAMGTYLLGIHVEDSDGHSLTRHFVALSPVPAYTTPFTGFTGSTNGSDNRMQLLPFLYTAYFVTVLCFFGLWLYEKYYRRRLVPVRILSHSHAHQYHHRVYAAKQHRHR